jgi:hypothetical protein
MAIPMNSAKHTSTRRAMNLCECALNMSDIIADEISAWNAKAKSTPWKKYYF